MNRQPDKTAALYCRLAHYFSSEDELAAKYQMETLTLYASEKHLSNTCFYCDWGVSGLAHDRPEYRRMLQDVLAGKVANVVVLNLSRLSRDYISAWELIGIALPQRGVAFYSVQDGDSIAETLNTFTRMRDEVLKACHLERGLR